MPNSRYLQGQQVFNIAHIICASGTVSQFYQFWERRVPPQNPRSQGISQGPNPRAGLTRIRQAQTCYANATCLASLKVTTLPAPVTDIGPKRTETEKPKFGGKERKR